MNIGLLIGTHGTPAFIHLHLECSKRFYPIKTLVIDDESEESKKIKDLCGQYGSDFLSSTGFSDSVFDDGIYKICDQCKQNEITINNVCKKCSKHSLGDINLTASGLEWAKNNNIDLLVKFSRRFLPLYDWRPELLRNALSTDYPAYTYWCETSKFGFRTECAAFVVKDWIDLGAIEVMRNCKPPVLTEAFIWANCLRLFQIKNLNKNKNLLDDFKSINPYWGHIKNNQTGYGHWLISGCSRSQKLGWRLWHHVNPPEDYLNMANKFEINCYSKEDFTIS
jgi:hypothetical protein